MKITKILLILSIITNLVLGYMYLRERSALIVYHEASKLMRDSIKECEYSGGLFNLTQEQMDQELFSIDGRCLYMKIRMETQDGQIETQ